MKRRSFLVKLGLLALMLVQVGFSVDVKNFKVAVFWNDGTQIVPFETPVNYGQGIVEGQQDAPSIGFSGLKLFLTALDPAVGYNSAVTLDTANIKRSVRDNLGVTTNSSLPVLPNVRIYSTDEGITYQDIKDDFGGEVPDVIAVINGGGEVNDTTLSKTLYDAAEAEVGVLLVGSKSTSFAVDIDNIAVNNKKNKFFAVKGIQKAFNIESYTGSLLFDFDLTGDIKPDTVVLDYDDVNDRHTIKTVSNVVYDGNTDTYSCDTGAAIYTQGGASNLKGGIAVKHHYGQFVITGALAQSVIQYDDYDPAMNAGIFYDGATLAMRNDSLITKEDIVADVINSISATSNKILAFNAIKEAGVATPVGTPVNTVVASVNGGPDQNFTVDNPIVIGNDTMYIGNIDLVNGIAYIWTPTGKDFFKPAGGVYTAAANVDPSKDWASQLRVNDIAILKTSASASESGRFQIKAMKLAPEGYEFKFSKDFVINNNVLFDSGSVWQFENEYELKYPARGYDNLSINIKDLSKNGNAKIFQKIFGNGKSQFDTLDRSLAFKPWRSNGRIQAAAEIWAVDTAGGKVASFGSWYNNGGVYDSTKYYFARFGQQVASGTGQFAYLTENATTDGFVKNSFNSLPSTTAPGFADKEYYALSAIQHGHQRVAIMGYEPQYLQDPVVAANMITDVVAWTAVDYSRMPAPVIELVGADGAVYHKGDKIPTTINSLRVIVDYSLKDSAEVYAKAKTLKNGVLKQGSTIIPINWATPTSTKTSLVTKIDTMTYDLTGKIVSTTGSSTVLSLMGLEVSGGAPTSSVLDSVGFDIKKLKVSANVPTSFIPNVTPFVFTAQDENNASINDGTAYVNYTENGSTLVTKTSPDTLVSTLMVDDTVVVYSSKTGYINSDSVTNVSKLTANISVVGDYGNYYGDSIRVKVSTQLPATTDFIIKAGGVAKDTIKADGTYAKWAPTTDTTTVTAEAMGLTSPAVTFNRQYLTNPVFTPDSAYVDTVTTSYLFAANASVSLGVTGTLLASDYDLAINGANQNPISLGLTAIVSEIAKGSKTITLKGQTKTKDPFKWSSSSEISATYPFRKISTLYDTLNSVKALNNIVIPVKTSDPRMNTLLTNATSNVYYRTNGVPGMGLVNNGTIQLPTGTIVDSIISVRDGYIPDTLRIPGGHVIKETAWIKAEPTDTTYGDSLSIIFTCNPTFKGKIQLVLPSGATSVDNGDTIKGITDAWGDFDIKARINADGSNPYITSMSEDSVFSYTQLTLPTVGVDKAPVTPDAGAYIFKSATAPVVLSLTSNVVKGNAIADTHYSIVNSVTTPVKGGDTVYVKQSDVNSEIAKGNTIFTIIANAETTNKRYWKSSDSTYLNYNIRALDMNITVGTDTIKGNPVVGIPDSVTVTVTVLDSVDRSVISDAKIYYTTDGFNATSSSAPLKGTSVVVPLGGKVNFHAERSGYRPNSPLSGTKFLTTKSVIELSDTTAFYGDSMVVEVLVSNTTGAYYTINGGTQTPIANNSTKVTIKTQKSPSDQLVVTIPDSKELDKYGKPMEEGTTLTGTYTHRNLPTLTVDPVASAVAKGSYIFDGKDGVFTLSLNGTVPSGEYELNAKMGSDSLTGATITYPVATVNTLINDSLKTTVKLTASALSTKTTGEGSWSHSPIGVNETYAFRSLKVKFTKVSTRAATAFGDTGKIQITAIDTLNGDAAVQDADISILDKAGKLIKSVKSGDTVTILGDTTFNVRATKSGWIPSTVSTSQYYRVYEAVKDGGAYYDRNGDGFIDYATIAFDTVANKPDSIICSAPYDANKKSTVLPASITIVGGKVLGFPVTPFGNSDDDLVTGFEKGSFITVNGTNFSQNGSLSVTTVDSVAPVIVSAEVISAESHQADSLDRLWVKFSEEMSDAELSGSTLFNLYHKADTIKPVFVTGSMFRDTVEGYKGKYRFSIASWGTGLEYPQRGDSLNILPAAGLKDTADNVQAVASNRKVALDVTPMPVDLEVLWIEMNRSSDDKKIWDKIVTLPAQSNVRSDSAGILILMNPKTDFTEDQQAEITLAISIYDQLGNKIVNVSGNGNGVISSEMIQSSCANVKFWDTTKKAPIERVGAVAMFWNMRNNAGRRVGPGAYKVIIKSGWTEGRSRETSVMVNVRK